MVHFDKEAVPGVTVVKELQDPNNTHKYTAKLCVSAIRERLQKEGVEILYNEKPARFNNFHFANFCKYYGLKSNKKLCYAHMQFSSPQYTYSQQAIDFIVDEIKKDPQNILNNIKK